MLRRSCKYIWTIDFGLQSDGAASGRINFRDTLAERSKAVAQGAIPKGRGFEPHRCHFGYVSAFACVCACLHFVLQPDQC